MGGIASDDGTDSSAREGRKAVEVVGMSGKWRLHRSSEESILEYRCRTRKTGGEGLTERKTGEKGLQISYIFLFTFYTCNKQLSTCRSNSFRVLCDTLWGSCPKGDMI